MFWRPDIEKWCLLRQKDSLTSTLYPRFSKIVLEVTLVCQASLFEPTGTTSYSSNNLAYFWPSQNSGDRWWRIPLRLSVKFKMRKLKKRFTPYFLLRYRLEYPIKFSDKIRKEWNTSACSAADPTGLPEHKQSFIQVRNMAWSGCQSTWQWRLGSGSWWFSIMQILISRASAGIFATGISRLSLLLLLLGLPSLVLIRRFTIPWGVAAIPLLTCLLIALPH